MVAKRINKSVTTRQRSLATTPEARENELINRAQDLAEEQLADGTASAQVITHYLKLGSTREKLEQTRLANENLLVEAKIEELKSRVVAEEMYTKALRAFSEYKGINPDVVEGELIDEEFDR